MTDRTFVRDQLAAAYRARARGDRTEAIRLLIYAVAEGRGSAEQNLQLLLEEAQRHADLNQSPRPATTPATPPK